MSLLAGRGVLLCSTLGHPVLPSAIRIGVYVVLHLLCGNWPSLWSIGPMMFLRVPAQHSWPLTLPHRSIALGRSYCWSFRSIFPHVTALLVHHWRGGINEFTMAVTDDELEHHLIGVMEWAIVAFAKLSVLKDVQLR